jgi:hypothetical protein
MKSLFILLALFGVSSCEKVEEVLQKGSLDAYFQCIKNNQEKEKLLGEIVIRDACTKKHSKKADNWRKVFSGCVANISLGDKPSVGISGCKNKSNKIITSVKVAINVENSPDSSDSIRLVSKHVPIFIKPGEIFRKEIQTNNSALLKNQLLMTPFCSSQPKVMCKSWQIEQIKYLDLDI